MPSILSIIIWTLATFAVFAAAHPGDDHEAEAAERRAFIERNPHLQKRCASTLKARGHASRAVARRRGLAEDMRRARGLPAEGIRPAVETLLIVC